MKRTENGKGIRGLRSAQSHAGSMQIKIGEQRGRRMRWMRHNVRADRATQLCKCSYGVIVRRTFSLTYQCESCYSRIIGKISLADWIV